MNVGAIEMSAHVLERAKYLNAFYKQGLALYRLILYRGNLSQCSKLFNFPQYGSYV